MKPILLAFLICACAASAAQAPAQEPRVEASATAVTSTGTISEFGAQGISIKTPAGVQPVRFISNDTTNYVDEEGNPLPLGAVQAGMPATIHYTKVGDTLIASKIVVNTRGERPSASATVVIPSAPAAPSPTATTTTTTTTNTAIGTTAVGTVAGVLPGAVVVRSDPATEPLRYRYSESVVYADETGAPLTVEAIRPGVPVTVHYQQTADGLVATKVVVTRTAAVPAPPAPVAPAQPASVTIPGKVVAPGAEVEVETRRETRTTIDR